MLFCLFIKISIKTFLTFHTERIFSCLITHKQHTDMTDIQRYMNKIMHKLVRRVTQNIHVRTLYVDFSSRLLHASVPHGKL
jgi:hypothetical protein